MQIRIPLALSVSALVATLIVTTPVHAQAIPDGQLNNAWLTNAQRVQSQQLERQPTAAARNVILFIGDGMGVSTLTVPRLPAMKSLRPRTWLSSREVKSREKEPMTESWLANGKRGVHKADT